MGFYALVEDADGNWVGIEPLTWPYPITEDIDEARRWARELAKQNGEDYAIYYRRNDIWSTAPLAVADLSDPATSTAYPVEIYCADGKWGAVALFFPSEG